MKKRTLFIVLIFCCCSALFAKEIVNNKIFISHTALDTTAPVKTDTTYIDENGKVKVFEKVEKEAEFPGGLAGWKEFVVNNLNPSVPADKGAPVGQYTVIVQFIVDKGGAVSDVKAKTNFGYGMEAEVIRMIKRSPKWIPAEQEGRFVNAYRQQPITFVVEEAKKKKRSRE